MPRTPGKLVVQDLSVVKQGYPDWTCCAIRTERENVHIATVGNVDRYFEGQAREHAAFIVEACNAHDALTARCARLEEFVEIMAARDCNCYQEGVGPKHGDPEDGTDKCLCDGCMARAALDGAK